MRVAAGCDGGGTKCTVRVVALDDDGALLCEGQASSGPANVRTDPDLALESILSATRAALRDAGLPDATTIDSYVAALAGAGTTAKQQAWQLKLSDALSTRKTLVIADVVALFAAVDPPHDSISIATVVGTGSIAWARYPNGEMRRAGGLGPDVGDEGGGFWIGKEAIRRVVASSEAAGTLSERMQHRFPTQIKEVLRSVRAGACVPREIAAVSSEVFDAAADDKMAKEIVEAAAGHITELIKDVAMETNSSRANRLPWICAGGVAIHQSAWLSSIQKTCEASGVYLDEPELVRAPVMGATRLAIRFV